MRKLVTAVAATGLALGLSACGSDDEPAAAVEEYNSAVREKDYATVCEALDPAIVDTLEQVDPDNDCPAMFEENEDAFAAQVQEEVEVTDTRIADDDKTATVTVEGPDGRTDEIRLVKVDGDWKITFEQ